MDETAAITFFAFENVCVRECMQKRYTISSYTFEAVSVTMNRFFSFCECKKRTWQQPDCQYIQVPWPPPRPGR